MLSLMSECPHTVLRLRLMLMVLVVQTVGSDDVRTALRVVVVVARQVLVRAGRRVVIGHRGHVARAASVRR